MSLHSWPGLSDCGRGCQALWGADSSAPFLTSRGDTQHLAPCSALATPGSVSGVLL